MRTLSVTKSIALATVAGFLFSTFAAPWVEAGFWEDRAAARRRTASETVDQAGLLALLPQRIGVAASGMGFQSPQLPSAPGWARSAVTPFADLRSCKDGGDKDMTVYVIMDAHDVYSGQKNVALLLERLAAGRSLLVGVEGSSGDFGLERYRNILPPGDQRVLVDHLLKKGFINGVEAYGMTSSALPQLWGVEDPALYDANVRAYRESLPLEKETREALLILKDQARALALKSFPPDLIKIDEAVEERHTRGADVRRTVETLVAAVGGVAGKNSKLFLSAMRKEESLSFPAVEQSRKEFIGRLAERLSPLEWAMLLQWTTDYRAGGRSAGDYYSDVKTLAKSKGMMVSDFPPFDKYVGYVNEADEIDPQALMTEIDELEDEAYKRHSDDSTSERVAWNRDLRLLERLVDHALTPAEWELYKSRGLSSVPWEQRARRLGLSTAAAETIAKNVKTFASFFEAAESRDDPLLTRLLEETRRRGFSAAALVTGGFHAGAVEKILSGRNIRTVILAPRMNDVPEGPADYLQAFAPTRTPLERLLLGDRLMMNPPSATSLGVQQPGSPFHDAATALDRAAMVYSVPLVESADLALLVPRWGAKATTDQHEGYRTVRLTFQGQDQTLVMATSEPEGADEKTLSTALQEGGGRVVETGVVGARPYALGGLARPDYRRYFLGAAAVLLYFWSFHSPQEMILACGVAGIVYGGLNPHRVTFPEGLRQVMDGSVVKTLHRGGQSGGGAVVGLNENDDSESDFFVEKSAKERDRRASLLGLMRESMDRLEVRTREAGYRAYSRILAIFHTRFGTNLAQPIAANAHPHAGSSAKDQIFFIGDGTREDAYEVPWIPPVRNPKVKSKMMKRTVVGAHNGDDNFTVVSRRGGRKVVISNKADARLSEHMTGYRPVAKGDSVQIPTRLDRWLTRGSVRASVRLALLILSLESLGSSTHDEDAAIQRAPSVGIVETMLGAKAFTTVEDTLSQILSQHPTATTLEDLFIQSGAEGATLSKYWDLEEVVKFKPGSSLSGWRSALEKQMEDLLEAAPWFHSMDQISKKRYSLRFADLFLKFFFTGDLRRAGLHLLNRADPTTTYGVMAGTLLEAEDAVWIRQNQPFYIWLTSDGKNVAGSSESKAYLGEKVDGHPLRYRLTLRHGEVASLKGSILAIDHFKNGRVAEYDISDLDTTLADRRWLDLEKSPHVVQSSAQSVAPENRVREDVEMIPWVNQQLAEDFSDPNSHNSVTASAFVSLLIDRLAKRRGSSSRGLDLVLVGTEKSYDAANQYALILEKISSLAGKRLNVKVIYGAEFEREQLVKLRDEGFGVDTVVMGVASSGQTANTFYTIEALYKAWKGLFESQHPGEPLPTPPHFLVSADMDNPYTEEFLGQGLAEDDMFKARNFVTFPKMDPFHPAEAATVTHKATERLLKEVSVLFARSLEVRSRRWKGRAWPAKTAELARRMVDNGDELFRRIIGKDADGNPVERRQRKGESNDIPEQVDKMATKISQGFEESLWAAAGTALFIGLSLILHITPASVVLGWVPMQAFIFVGGVPILTVGMALVFALLISTKFTFWKWHWLFGAMGFVAVVTGSLFLGQSYTMIVDAVAQWLGYGPWGSALGQLPLPFMVDVSLVNLANVATYIFFFFGLTVALRKVQGRPLWDRLGGRILVLADAQHANARLSAARWRRMVNHRFGWMGLQSVNESSLGRLTHEEALNSNVRGNIFLQGESRTTEGPTVMNFMQLGGSPNGPGRAWRMGIGHKKSGSESEAYSEGYLSLHMDDDNPAGENPDLLALQELLQDAPARDTAGMVLALKVAEKMSRHEPLNFIVGMTSSEAKTSTTQQPFPPLSDDVVAEVFGYKVRTLEAQIDDAESEDPEAVSGGLKEPGSATIVPSPVKTPVPSVNPANGPAEVIPFFKRMVPQVSRWVVRPVIAVMRVVLILVTLGLLTSHGDKLISNGLKVWANPVEKVSVPGTLSPPLIVPGPLKDASSLKTLSTLTTYLWVREADAEKVKLIKGQIPEGVEIAVLRRSENGKLVRVKPPNSRAVWVKSEDFNAMMEQSRTQRPSSEIAGGAGAVAWESLALMMGPVGPVLGGLGMRRVAVPRTPGAVIRRRLLEGARRPWNDEDRPLAEEVVEYLDHPIDSRWMDKALRLSLAYGGLAGANWGTDRALVDDFRQARRIVKGEELSLQEGRGLTVLAGQASRWTRTSPSASLGDGVLPVIDLTPSLTETFLFRFVAAAMGQGEKDPSRIPILVARSEKQKAQIEEAFDRWWNEARLSGNRPALSRARWVVLDRLADEEVQRGEDGLLSVVRLSGVFRLAGVPQGSFSRVDVVSGVTRTFDWDRSDLPADVLVRLVVGVLDGLMLTAPLEEAQGALRSARRALVAA